MSHLPYHCEHCLEPIAECRCCTPKPSPGESPKTAMAGGEGADPDAVGGWFPELPRCEKCGASEAPVTHVLEIPLDLSRVPHADAAAATAMTFAMAAIDSYLKRRTAS